VTAIALHCQRNDLTCLAQRGSRWILTVKGNQSGLHRELAEVPWRHVPTPTATPTRGHGRQEIRTLRIRSVSTGIDFAVGHKEPFRPYRGTHPGADSVQR
jgi:hypothetical protein